MDVGIIGLDTPHAVEFTKIYAFMEAAHQSRRRGGGTVMLEEVLEKARQDAAAMREQGAARGPGIRQS